MLGPHGSDDDVRRARRAPAPGHSRPAPGTGALGGGPGRGRLAQPARRLEAPAGTARGRPRRGPDRRPAALVPGARRAARRDRRLARAVPAVLDRTPRRPGTPPRRRAQDGDSERDQEEEGGVAMATNPTPHAMADGMVETIDGRYVLRFERRFQHPVERVWDALTRPERIPEWWGEGEVELELVEGGKYDVRTTGPPELIEAVIAEAGE